jgi:tRNA(Ile)-lysidine synthase
VKKDFIQHINHSYPYLNKARLLVAVSGGVDSMVLTHLLSDMGFDIGLAHVNFGLRGKESDEDEIFITGFARERDIPLHLHHPETEIFAKVHRTSIQVAARELRYEWFRQLMKTVPYDYLLTAHQADDNVETFFLNLHRRTGLAGLTGIPAVNGNIIRPLLPFSRKEILQYAQTHSIPWREDSSNAKRDYLRNNIRHTLIPALQSTFPDYLPAFQKVMRHLLHSKHLLSDYMQYIKSRIWDEKHPWEVHIDIPTLYTLPHPEDILFELLKDYGFASRTDIYSLTEAQSGKTIFSESHRIIKDREKLILVVLNQTPDIEILIKENQKHIQIPMHNKTFDLLIETYPMPREFSPLATKDKVFFDLDKIRYPLKVRRWKAGDYFLPFGMNGRKKISDYLTDHKINLYDKENIYLLCDAEGEIIWLIGHRTDNRFRIDHKTKNILEIKTIN